MDKDLLFESVPGPVSDPEDSLVLLGRARAGDALATGELFERYQDRIRRIVRVRLGPGLRRFTESGDLVQETCRAALQSLEHLEVGSDFDLLDWLSRIATHRVRDFADHVRAAKRDLGRAGPLPAEGRAGAGPVPVDSRTTPSGHAFRAEVRALLDDVVAGLPETYREAILLRDYEGAEWPDVARILRTPTLHAAQQLHQRAWIKVRTAAAPRLAGLRGRP